METRQIKQILLEQKEEIKRLDGNLIKRDVNVPAEDNLIKVITGVRRCGKSVLAHQLLKGKEYGYVNFDDERFVGVKANDLNNFLEALTEINPNAKHIILDEIQNVNGWELFVNRLRRLGYNLVITGSNSKLLSRELSTHLTGRHLEIQLFPFSFAEFLRYHNFEYTENDFMIAEKKGHIKNYFQQYLHQGGFPELFKISGKERYLKELYDNIITRDIILRYNIRYVKDLREIALYLLSNFSSKISYNKIKNIFEIKSVHTVKNYVAYIQETYLISQIYPFSFKIKHQLMQSKKVYAIDSGIINCLALTPNVGRLYENIVFIELLRRGKEPYFYYDNLHEVDFVLRENGKVKQLIQVCLNLNGDNTKKREVNSLIKASINLKCNDLLIINDDYAGEEKINGFKIKFIPLWEWLLTKSEFQH